MQYEHFPCVQSANVGVKSSTAIAAVPSRRCFLLEALAAAVAVVVDDADADADVTVTVAVGGTAAWVTALACCTPSSLARGAAAVTPPNASAPGEARLRLAGGDPAAPPATTAAAPLAVWFCGATAAAAVVVAVGVGVASIVAFVSVYDSERQMRSSAVRTLVTQIYLTAAL